MAKITKYLEAKLVSFPDLPSRDAVLNAMVDQLHQAGKLSDKEEFHQAILDREKVVSTGIGMGIAIPHAKLIGYNDFFIAIAILQKGVDWKALDGAPVRLVFMIGGPADKQTEYLQILSSLTMALKDEERRKKLLTLNSPHDIIKLFTGF
jgi:PTS system nitrogen regulatory IIA component